MEQVSKEKGEVWEAATNCTITVKRGMVFMRFKNGNESMNGTVQGGKLAMNQGDKITSHQPYTFTIET